MKQSMLPASSPLPPLARSPFPQGGRLLVGCYSMIASESPLSVPLGHLSPKGETISYLYALLVFVISEGEGFFGAPALQSLESPIADNGTYK